MKSKFAILLTCTFIALCLSGTALAANWSFNLVTDYAAGDSQLVYNMSFTTDEDVKVFSYDLEAIFDKDELEFVSYTHTPLATLTDAYFGPMTTNIDANGNGTLDNFQATTFTPGGVTVVAGTYQVGSFTFNVVNAVQDGEIDFAVDYDDPMHGVNLNSTAYYGNASQMYFDAVDVSAVPVPSALWLMGVGLACLTSLRRRNA